MNGIIEYQPEDLLGMSVQAYDLGALHDKLEPSTTLPAAELPHLNPIVSGGGNLSSLKSSPKKEDFTLTRASTRASNIFTRIDNEGPSSDGPLQIESELANVTLSRLRGEDIANELTQAICWHGLKYSADQTDEAVEKRIKLLGRNTDDPNSLLAVLDSLSDVLRSRYDRLASLYNMNGVEEVLNPSSTSTSSGETKGGQTFTSTSQVDTTYFGREAHAPPLDNKARYLRSEAALRQERLAAFRLVKLNSRRNVLLEKAMTAAEIRKLQIAYIDTFLVAPFDGVVTAVFRNVGDFVATGQPVLRLENDKTVYLVGTVKCRSLIRIGDTATVTTTLFGEPGATPVEIEGTVVAVRGHEAIDEQWNVLIRCDNQAPAPKSRILPLNYNFDFDSTEIEIESS